MELRRRSDPPMGFRRRSEPPAGLCHPGVGWLVSVALVLTLLPEVQLFRLHERLVARSVSSPAPPTSSQSPVEDANSTKSSVSEGVNLSSSSNGNSSDNIINNDNSNTTNTSTSAPTYRFFTIPPIPANARDVHEVRIVELIVPARTPLGQQQQQGQGSNSSIESDAAINQTHSKAGANGEGDSVESRAGALGPVLTPTDVRPEDSNLGALGYHQLLDGLWTRMNISRACILYNNFDAIRGCDCQACLQEEPDFRTQLCAFGRAVRNSSEINEYIRRVMGPDAPTPSEVFMQEDFYLAMCDLKRCPRVPNRCCNPAYNPAVLRRQPLSFVGEVTYADDYLQVDSVGCPLCHPVVPLGTPLPSLARQCILEELLSFAPIQPLSLPSL